MGESALTAGASRGSGRPGSDELRVAVHASNSSIEIDVRELRVLFGGMAVLGLNGAGKSTFLNALEQALAADGVSVTLVPQGARLPSQFRVRELLEYLGSLRGMDARSRTARASELLSVVELTEQASMRVSRLSGGMHQRLLVAQGLMTRDPRRVLILDEPTVSLDERQAQSVWDALSAVAEERFVIVSSHESVQALSSMRHAVWIDKGDVVGPFASAPVRQKAKAEGLLIADIFDRPHRGRQ